MTHWSLPQGPGHTPGAASSRRTSCRRTIPLAVWSPPWRPPPPRGATKNLYGVRGTCENAIKAVQNDLHSDRTSATTFLANAMRLLLACAASVLHHALRTPTLQPTALAQAPPSTIILTLFTIATQIKQYKDRMLLHLPSSCPVKALLQRVTTLLCAVPELVCNTS
jgi:Transposase DDE domain group 1